MIQATSNSSFIEVTQDGIARILSSTPDDRQGIYTEGLETCIAIIIVGNESCSIIHATNKLSAESVKNEFKQHTVKFWTIAYNPNFYPEGADDENLQEHIGLFIESIEEVAVNLHLKIENTMTLRLYEAINGFVSVNRLGNIDVDKKPEKIITPPNKDKRHRINTFNNFFSENTKFVSGDLQFDGNLFCDCSSLSISPREMIKIANTQNNPFNILERLRFYLEKYGPEDHKKILQEEALENIKNKINFNEIITKLNQVSGYYPLNNSEFAQSKTIEHKPEKVAIKSRSSNKATSKNLFIESVGINNILSQLDKITENITQIKWKSINGNSVSLKAGEKDLAEAIEVYFLSQGLSSDFVKVRGGDRVIIDNSAFNSLEGIKPMPKVTAKKEEVVLKI